MKQSNDHFDFASLKTWSRKSSANSKNRPLLNEFLMTHAPSVSSCPMTTYDKTSIQFEDIYETRSWVESLSEFMQMITEV